jgi:hypothetical protein
MLYEPGETVVLIADLMPAVVEPYPDELPWTRDGHPQGGVMFRVLITARGLVVGWQAGGGIERRDLPVADPETITATFRGGTVGPYEVRLTGGCKCGARRLQSWAQADIFPGSPIAQSNTLNQAQVDARRDSRYGLPSVRDTTVRYTRMGG